MRVLTSLLCLCAPSLAQDPLVSEFCASNTNVLDDEDGDSSDWLELHNPGTGPVDLGGWFLTDDDDELNRWRIPDGIVLDAGGQLVVFASGKDRSDAAGELHTSFKLGKDGEYLALVRPDGVTVAHEYAPEYPPQYTNVSYGLAFDPDVTVVESFFPDPTPGAPNGTGGPLLLEAEHEPAVPLPGEDVVVRVSAPQGLAGGTIQLHRRVNYDSETTVLMADDGLAPDVTAGDGVFAGTVPASLFGEGDMVRWRLEATDSSGTTVLPSGSTAQ